MSKKEKTVLKLAAKSAKVKAKLAAKKAKIVGAAVAVVCMLMLCGCATQPSRAQTQTIRDCTFYVMVPAGAPTNAPASAFALGTVGDLFTQNQVVENSGTETTSPQHTVSPQTDVAVPIGTGGGSSWGSLFSGISSLFNGGTVKDAEAAAAASPGECADGSCSETK